MKVLKANTSSESSLGNVLIWKNEMAKLRKGDYDFFEFVEANGDTLGLIPTSIIINLIDAKVGKVRSKSGNNYWIQIPNISILQALHSFKQSSDVYVCHEEYPEIQIDVVPATGGYRLIRRCNGKHQPLEGTFIDIGTAISVAKERLI